MVRAGSYGRTRRVPRRSSASARLCGTFFLLATSFLLSGCKLIDQTTFAPSPSHNPAVLPAPPRVDRRTALITIDQGTDVQAYRSLLRYAVEQARSRDPNVQFDVVVVVPGIGDAAAQASALAAAQPEASVVMQEIGRDGVTPTQVHLRAAVDTTAVRRQIRVYVR
ncbi:MAG TPA: hypothetical protein VFW75_04670 [Acetobacteraceae bacterium]|nr:hypothetical protein [Acetobacteraceae bacterium]